MATHQPFNNEGFTDPNRVTAGSAAKSDGSVATPANYASNAAMNTRLLALGYSQKEIDSLTHNDKIYVIRLSDDPTTV